MSANALRLSFRQETIFRLESRSCLPLEKSFSVCVLYFHMCCVLCLQACHSRTCTSSAVNPFWWTVTRRWEPSWWSSETTNWSAPRRWVRWVVTESSNFFCVRCDDRAKSTGPWLLGSLPSAVVQSLAPQLGAHFSVFWPKLLAYCLQVWAGLNNVLRSLFFRATFTVGWISKT